VNFVQNHDQIGNRACGERLEMLAPAAAVEAALAVLLIAPMPPLMFMGEEWGATHPFPFFCDFHGELAEAVRQGRRREFAEAYANPSIEVPDPLTEATFQSAMLDWSELERDAHRQRLGLVRDLLCVRRNEIVPRLAGLKSAEAGAEFVGDVLQARWRLADGSVLRLLVNLSDGESMRPGASSGRPIWGGEPPASLAPWFVYWAIEDG
jgi:maltooligosyltrehalose trehalohydrolase